MKNIKLTNDSLYALFGCSVILTAGIVIILLGIPGSSRLWGLVPIVFAGLTAYELLKECRDLQKPKPQLARTKNVLDLPRNTRIR